MSLLIVHAGHCFFDILLKRSQAIQKYVGKISCKRKTLCRWIFAVDSCEIK